MNIIYIGKHNKMFNVEQHKHVYGEIVYCTGGNGVFKNENNDLTCYKKGNAVLIPPNIVHSNYSGEGFSNFFVAVSDTGGNMPTGIKCVSDNERGDLLSVIEQAHFYFNCKAQNREQILFSLAELMMQYLILFSDHGTLSEYSRMISQSIISNFSQSDYKLTDFIKKLPFNSEYLCKKFSQETGKTPSQYLNCVRISHAKKMLARQNAYGLSIKEIANASGFADALYFSRVFKAATGSTPTQYAAKKQAFSEKELFEFNTLD